MCRQRASALDLDVRLLTLNPRPFLWTDLSPRRGGNAFLRCIYCYRKLELGGQVLALERLGRLLPALGFGSEPAQLLGLPCSAGTAASSALVDALLHSLHRQLPSPASFPDDDDDLLTLVMERHTRAIVFLRGLLNLKLHWCVVGEKCDVWVFLLLLYQTWLKPP